MASNDPILILFLAGVGVIGYYLITRSGTDQAAAAGKWTAQNVINPAKNPATKPLDVFLTTLQSRSEGHGDPKIVPTLTGMNDSNWTYQLKDGSFIGVPAGMTPNEFCRGSPDSPVCKGILAGVL